MQSKILLLAGVMMTLGLSACGGDGSLDGPPPVATTPTPTAVPTPTPAVTPPPPEVVTLALDADTWEVDPGTLVKQEVSGGVRFEPTAGAQQFRAILPADTAVQGAGIALTIEADDAFVASDAEFQIIIQQNGGGFGGFFGCYVANDALDASSTITIDPSVCVAMGDALDSPPAEGWRFGIQIEVAEGGTVGGGLSILNAQLVPDGATLPTEPTPTPTPDPNLIQFDLTTGWALEGDSTGTEITYVADEGVQFDPKVKGVQLVYPVAGPRNLNGATFELTFVADADYIASTASAQPFMVGTGGNTSSVFSCFIGNADLVPAGNSFSCAFGDTGWELTDGQSVNVGFLVPGNPDQPTPAGTITITEASIVLGGTAPTPTPTPDPNLIQFDLTAGWALEGDSTGTEITYIADEGVQFDPKVKGVQLVYPLAGPRNLNGATFELTFVADADYIASTASAQPFMVGTGGNSSSVFGCFIGNADLVPAGNSFSCAFGDTGWELTDGQSVNVGFLVPGNPDQPTPAGTITITEASVVLPGA